MSADLQKRFKELAKGLGVYVGGKLATQNDLSAFRRPRCDALSSRFGPTCPGAAARGADPRRMERLRSGAFHGGAIQWDEAWTMDDSVQPLFPAPSWRYSVAAGRRPSRRRRLCAPIRARCRCAMRRGARLPADRGRKVQGGGKVAETDRGAIQRRFGLSRSVPPGRDAGAADAVFRRAQIARPPGAGPIGAVGMSRRSSQEKKPWKSQPGVENQVEAQFIRPTLLGESILPYRIFRLYEAVIPVSDSGEILDAKAARDRGFDKLAGWMRKAEAVWGAHNTTELSFNEQLDYFGKLGTQFPIASFRVVTRKQELNRRLVCCETHACQSTIN